MTIDLQTLALQYLSLGEQIDNLVEIRDAVIGQIRTAGIGSHQAGNLTVSVQPNHRFDAKRAASILPAAITEQCTTTKTVSAIDRKKVEALAPEYLPSCMAEYDPKVSIK